VLTLRRMTWRGSTLKESRPRRAAGGGGRGGGAGGRGVVDGEAPEHACRPSGHIRPGGSAREDAGVVAERRRATGGRHG
jgi:hypothetical protein